MQENNSKSVPVFGQKLVEKRRGRNWTQETLAKRADLSKSSVRRAERSENIDLATLQSIASALNASVWEFTPRETITPKLGSDLFRAKAILVRDLLFGVIPYIDEATDQFICVRRSVEQSYDSPAFNNLRLSRNDFLNLWEELVAEGTLVAHADELHFCPPAKSEVVEFLGVIRHHDIFCSNQYTKILGDDRVQLRKAMANNLEALEHFKDQEDPENFFQAVYNFYYQFSAPFPLTRRYIQGFMSSLSAFHTQQIISPALSPNGEVFSRCLIDYMWRQWEHIGTICLLLWRLPNDPSQLHPDHSIWGEHVKKIDQAIKSFEHDTAVMMRDAIYDRYSDGTFRSAMLHERSYVMFVLNEINEAIARTQSSS